MKKLLAIIMCLALVLSFAACGGDKTDTTDGTGTAETDDYSFTFGTVDDNVYENEFIGIGCSLPSDWTFYSEEEIMELNGIVVDSLDEDIQEMIENATLLYDMYAQASDGLNNINICLEKVAKIQLDALDIADNLELLSPQLKSMLEGMGYTNVVTTVTTAEVDGEELPVLKVTGDIGDIQITQYQFNIKCDGFLASVTVSDYSGNGIDLLDYFYFID